VALVELLLARGADPNLRAPDGLSPLAASRLGDHPAVMRRLLKAGARDPERPPRAGLPAGVGGGRDVTPAAGSGR
jgi:ankyrin repeat protein